MYVVADGTVVKRCVKYARLHDYTGCTYHGLVGQAETYFSGKINPHVIAAVKAVFYFYVIPVSRVTPVLFHDRNLIWCQCSVGHNDWPLLFFMGLFGYIRIVIVIILLKKEVIVGEACKVHFFGFFIKFFF